MKFFSRKKVKEDQIQAIYNRFEEVKRRLEGSPFHAASAENGAPLGFYDGRPIIGESNSVIGGVYLSVTPHEAIVVDEKYGELVPLYDELLRKYVDEVGTRDKIEQEIFPLAVNLVKSHLRFDLVGFRNLMTIDQIGTDHKVSLDMFVKKHVGVSRHQVLLLAYLLYKLRDRELISGSICIDPFFKELPGDDEVLRYTNSEGKQFLFDPVAESEKSALYRHQLYQGVVEEHDSQ